MTGFYELELEAATDGYRVAREILAVPARHLDEVNRRDAIEAVQKAAFVFQVFDEFSFARFALEIHRRKKWKQQGLPFVYRAFRSVASLKQFSKTRGKGGKQIIFMCRGSKDAYESISDWLYGRIHFFLSSLSTFSASAGSVAVMRGIRLGCLGTRRIVAMMFSKSNFNVMRLPDRSIIGGPIFSPI